MTKESDLSIEDRVDYLTKEMKKYDKPYDDEVKDTVFDKYDKETLDRINSCLSDIGVYSNEGKKEIQRMFNDMVKDKVKQFIDLLLNGESLENAMIKSGVADMKLTDVFIRALVYCEYVEEISNIFANTKEAIKTVDELDNALVELKKSSDKFSKVKEIFRQIENN